MSWLGLWIHEVHRVPALLGFTPDGDLFMLVIALVFVGWWLRTRSAGAAALRAYAAINLVGGSLSVLPLGWMPFAKEQTAVHYTAHVVYAACQVPLLILTVGRLIRGRPRNGDTVQGLPV